MTHILAIFLSLAFIATPVYAQLAEEPQQQYMEVLSDVPLMDGLEAVSDSALVFDKPDGRIVEAMYFSDSVTAEEISAYYGEVLPQLGWTLREPQDFLREKERLTFISTQNEGEAVVIFSLSPFQAISEVEQ